MVRVICAVLVSCLLVGPAAVAQSPSTTTETVLVLPFENQSSAPGLQWISESFPEVLGERISSLHFYVVSREDRATAFDRAGIPTSIQLSRVTLYRIAEQMDVDYVVLGKFNYDGQIFTATAQLLNMKRLHLTPEIKESGPLVNMVDVQCSLAWDLLHELKPEELPSKQAFLSRSPSIRLDAFENYVRGITAGTRQDRIKHFRESIRLNPNYAQAMFELGRTYFENREYESAASWFARVPRSDAFGNQAAFLLGLSSYYLGDFAKADEAFRYVANTLPLTEVYNNLGVVAGRRGRRSELDYLQKAVAADPSDPDY